MHLAITFFEDWVFSFILCGRAAEHTDIASFAAGVLVRCCEHSKYGPEAAPGAFQYFSHKNS